MRTRENSVNPTNAFMLLAAAIATAFGLTACGGSGAGASATTSSPPAPHAVPSTPSAESGLRAAPRPAGLVITVRPSEYGSILDDRRDRTIYVFTRDGSSASTCYGRCAAVWPPVLTRGAPRRAGRLPGALGTTRRRDGATQVTYGGHPLYYYTGDVSPGEILCQNVEEFGGTWLVVSPSGKPIR